MALMWLVSNQISGCLSLVPLFLCPEIVHWSFIFHCIFNVYRQNRTLVSHCFLLSYTNIIYLTKVTLKWLLSVNVPPPLLHGIFIFTITNCCGLPYEFRPAPPNSCLRWHNIPSVTWRSPWRGKRQLQVIGITAGKYLFTILNRNGLKTLSVNRLKDVIL